MKRHRVFVLALVAAFASSGCAMMLYPIARAFGGASESQLAISRKACADMKTAIVTGPLFVSPTLVFRAWKPAFETGAAGMVVERLRRDVNTNAELIGETPAVTETVHGGNQLRYMNARGRAYAAWVAAKKAPAGHWVFTEIIANREGTEVVGGYCWVIDASGRIAYNRLFNSHFFKSPSLPGFDAFLDFVMKTFVRDLAREPIELFPKWGVG